MGDGDLVWDADKRRLNRVKHGLDFVDAETVFAGPTITVEDDRFDYGEPRFVTLGLLRDVVVVIAHTEAEHSLRIISMRKATKHEQGLFFSTFTD